MRAKERINKTELTPEQVAEIKQRVDKGERAYRLADEYKVNVKRIQNIVIYGKDL